MIAEKVTAGSDLSILHVANWYPNPWNEIEGNFISSQINLFCDEIPGEAVVVQVRRHPEVIARFCRAKLPGGASGYFLLTSLDNGGRITAVLTTLMLLFVLLRHRFWRFSALHFHIAIPLLCHVHIWRHLIRKPVLISEHCSAYHYNFYLPRDSSKLAYLRRPFRYQYPLLSVSQALIQDVRNFSRYTSFPAYVLPNIVPLHGASYHANSVVRLFTVNRWVDIKDPMHMLRGLALAIDAGATFQLIIGGEGPLLGQMEDLIQSTSLLSATQTLGWMSKEQIAVELAHADGYLFSSLYETFSVACAEALGAGVPLIGPIIPAIAEYADHSSWQQVQGRTAIDWKIAILQFLDRLNNNAFNSPGIARQCSERFSPEKLRKQYRLIVEKHVCK